MACLRLRVLLLVVACCGGTTPGWAIDPAKAPLPVDTATLTEAAFLERLTRVEESLQRDGAPPLFAARPAVIPLTDSPTLYTTNAYGAEGVSYVAFVLHLLNTTSAVQSLDPASVSLVVNGTPVRFGDVPPAIHGFVVDIAGRGVSVADALPNRPISMPARKVTSVLMLFAPVESRGTVPPLTLKLESAGVPIELDLNRLHDALLEADIDRLGPAGACAVVSVRGVIDGINAGRLADRLNQLGESGVNRFVFQFPKHSPAPSLTILGWLASMAAEGQIGDLYRGLPSLPTEVAELHFTGISTSQLQEIAGESRGQRHDEIEAALAEALWAPYRVAARRVVLQELEQGDPRGRAAALACGAHAFRAIDLPKIEPWIDDPSKAVRQAACSLIARFDTDDARQMLQTAVRSGSPQSAESALAALLSARAARTVAAGVEAADGPTAIPELTLLRLQIQSRNPAFASRIREAARSGSNEARHLALSAISADRSPETVRLFQEAFASPNREIRNAALQAAAKRLEAGDQHLRTLAIEEALRRLQSGVSDRLALDIASETRDARFVALFAARLHGAKAATPDRSLLIEQLTRIGGSEATSILTEVFDSLTPPEQSQVLGHVWREDPERALPIAMRMVASGESHLSELSRQVLVHDGSDDAAAALRHAVRTQSLPNREDLLTALSNIGSPAAIDALCEFRDGGNALLRTQAEIAFANYWSRSPAADVADTALLVMESQIPASPADLAEAEKLFEGAVELDRLLPQVYRGRGNLRLRRSQWARAASDFEAAMELNPYDEISLTGAAIAYVMLGRDTEALDWLQQSRRFFANNSNFAYNTACAFARALEVTLNRPASPERDRRAAELRDQAFQNLQQSLDMGFGGTDDELTLLKKDPDLLSLHSDPRFPALVERATAGPARLR